MTKKQIRNFSAEEKTKIVLELLKEEITIKTYAMRKKMVNYVEYNLPKLRYIERLMA